MYFNISSSASLEFILAFSFSTIYNAYIASYLTSLPAELYSMSFDIIYLINLSKASVYTPSLSKLICFPPTLIELDVVSNT